MLWNPAVDGKQEVLCQQVVCSFVGFFFKKAVSSIIFNTLFKLDQDFVIELVPLFLDMRVASFYFPGVIGGETVTGIKIIQCRKLFIKT